MIIEMEGFSIELSRKRIKNINLRINAQGEVKVSAPMKLPLAVIHRFLQEKRDWIVARCNRLQVQSKHEPAQFKTGECHFFLGKPYQLIVHESSEKNGFSIEGEILKCSVDAGADRHHIQNLLHNWYRQQMELLLPALINKWELIIGVDVQSWGIKAMKTRWGSCIPLKKRIWINLHLMQKPLSCLEYVVVHELVHLLEASHNARFYALMGQFMPDWKSNKQLLQANSPR